MYRRLRTIVLPSPFDIATNHLKFQIQFLNTKAYVFNSHLYSQVSFVFFFRWLFKASLAVPWHFCIAKDAEKHLLLSKTVSSLYYLFRYKEICKENKLQQQNQTPYLWWYRNTKSLLFLFIQ